MNTRYYNREEVRNIDRRAIEEYGMPGVVLMENAGRGAAEYLMQIGIQGKVMICAGKGNNAGDGFVIARYLENNGYEVSVLLIGDSADLKGDAAINFNIINTAGISITTFADDFTLEQTSCRLSATDWVVDALLGTGIKGEVREPFATIINAINDCETKVLAIDLPSGLDCDLGKPAGVCVQADHTVTFVGLKRGFANEQSKQWTGDVQVVDIGVPHVMLQQD